MNLHDIEHTLASQEQQFNDIVDGTEKKVVWYNGVQQTNFAIVYLHGFSASRQEINPSPQLLAEKLGANIYYTRLKGHGRSEQAMAIARVQDWLDDTQQAYEIGALIGKKIILLSTSTGGTLATWLVNQPFASKIFANVMISPNFGIKQRSGWLLQYPLGLKLAKWINGPTNSFIPLNQTHQKYWTERYPLEAIIPVIKLVNKIREMDLSKIKSPQMIIYSIKDQVVDSKKTLELSKRFNQTKLTLVHFTESTDPSQHVLAGDACSPNTNQLMAETISSYILDLSL